MKKSVIKAFSLSGESEKSLKKLQKSSGLGSSEIIRNLLKNGQKKIIFAADRGKNQITKENLNPEDTNKILKYYYQLISTQAPKPTVVIGVAIISKSNKVLIGNRKKTDQYIKNLTWTFPTGRFSSLDFQAEILSTIKRETGLSVRNAIMFHARLIPDSPKKTVRIVALYYHIRITSGKSIAGGSFNQVKWVPATDVTRFFTTSVSDEVMNFLGQIG